MILIFDLFETLLNTRSIDFNRGLVKVWERYYQDKCSFEEIKAFGEEQYLYLLQLHGQGKEYAFVKEELPEYAEKFGGEVVLMSVEEEAEFLLLCNEMESMPGIPEALAEFKKRGIPMYVLSNSGFTADALSIMLEKFGLRQFFDQIWSSADFGVVKPCKALFDKVIESVLAEHPQEEKQNIVFIGDTYKTDIMGARGAGIRAVWIDHKGESAERVSADPFVDTVADTKELLHIVEKCSRKIHNG